MVLSKSFRVWRKYRPRSVLLETKENPEEALLFETNAIAILSPVEVDIIRREYGECLAAYGSLGVLTVNVTTETYHYLVLITGCQSVGKLWDAEVFRITQTTFVPLSTRAYLELVQDVGKLLASGRFYFAYPSTGTTFDLLSCAQKQGKEQSHFFWNKGLFAYLKRFGVNCDKWLSRVMCGSVEIQTVYAGDKQAKACLISRLSCERAGTRFNVRGTNDEGHVANFVETEQAIYVDNSVASFVQIRGLVPLFWEQPGLQTGGGMIRIKFSRGYTCSQPAFERHFEWCLLHYGPLLCLNLLGTRNQEQMLSSAFQEHLQQLSSAYCAEMVCYDYHRYCKGSNVSLVLNTQFLPMVETFVNAHGFYISQSSTVQRQQTGTLRANCLDCLDRTNSVQSFLGHHMLTQLMSALGLSTKPSVLSRFEQLFSLAWSRNGDSISRLYAGTRALALEGKMKLKDGARSVQRTILNNFMDNTKQEAIDMLLHSNSYSGELGLKAKALLDATDALGPIPFKQSVCDRWSDFTNPEKLRVCIGTWNVNGGRHVRSIALKNQSMHDWLLDGPRITGVVKEHPEEFRHPPDIYAIGFQELVGLTASNIVSASTSNRREWGMELQRVLSRDYAYELLTAEQLVGICLYIFIRPKLIPYIRDVAVSTVKTGMSGKAGNKGAVAIRFLLHASSLCFVCSHFAAHQSRVMERNQDFADIWKKVQFSGQSLEVHDYVFWCGDLNYRIDLPSSISKDHIAHQRWDKLCKQDQLIKQKKLNKVFQGFNEGKMTFAPTYKYDEFSDDYDTSEKCRTPAWCDRILWRRRSLRTELSTRASPSQLTETNSEVCDTGAPPCWDFGLHPSDADVVCGKEMEGGGGGGGGLVNTGHTWHPGRLLYYNRAELKQSDHRPVVALLEVDIYRVNPKRRAEVTKEVILSLGPPDPTIVIAEQEEGMSVPMPLLLDALRPYGQVVLVRVMNDLTLVTFQHSQSALAATALNGQEVGGVRVDVYLNSPWPPVSPTSDQEVTRATREGKIPRNPGAQRLKVLTSEQLVGVQETEAASGKPEESKDLLEFSFTEQQNLTEMEAESTMEDTSTEKIEAGVTDGMGVESTDELEAVQSTEMEADDYEELDSGQSDEPEYTDELEYTDEVRPEHTMTGESEPVQEEPIGTKLGQIDEMEPGEISNSEIEQGQPNGTESGHRDEVESGQRDEVESGQRDEVESGQRDEVESGHRDEVKSGHRDEVESGQRDEVKSGQRHEVESGQRDEVKSGHRDEVKSGQRHEVESGQRHEVESGQRDEVESGQRHEVESGQRHEVESGQRHEVESGQRDEVESGQRHEVESGQRDEVESGQRDEMESGQMEEIQPGQEQSQEQPIDVVVSPELEPSLTGVSEEEGNGNPDPPGEPQLSDEHSEQAVKQQPKEVSEPSKPQQTADKTDPPPRPPMPPSRPSQAPPKNSGSPEENRLASRPQRPPARPRPPRPQMPMRERTKSLPHRPVHSGSSADVKLAPPPASDNPQAPPRHKKQARSVAEHSTSQTSKPPGRPTKPPKRPSHSPNVPHKHSHSSNSSQKPSKPARPPPPKKT